MISYFKMDALMARIGFFIILLSMLQYIVFAVPAYAQNPEHTKDSHQLYEQALMQFKQGEAEESVKYLQKVLEVDPFSLAGHLLLARSYLQLGYSGFAEKEFKIAERLGADRALYILELAQSYREQLKYETLLNDIYTHNYSNSLNAQILVARGNAFLQLGRYDEAMREFDDSIRLDSQMAAAYLGKATIQLSRGEFENSLSNTKLAWRLDPEDADVWYALGAIDDRSGKSDQAYSKYQKVITLDPTHFSANSSLAGTYMKRGQLEAAVDRLNILYQKYDSNPQIPYLLAIVTAKQGDAGKAREWIIKAKELLDAFPKEAIRKHGPTLFLSGLINYDQKNDDEAVEDLTEFIGRYPRQIRARMLLATIFLRKGAANSAVEILETGLGYSEDNYELLVMLGDAYLRKGQHFKSIEAFNRAAAIKKLGADAKTKLGMSQLFLGEAGSAKETLSDVLESDSAVGTAGILLVITALHDNRPADALNIAKTLKQKEPQNPTAQNLLAIAYVANGDRDSARKIFNSMLEEQPDFFTAKLNIAKLDYAEGSFKSAESGIRALLNDQPDNVTLMSEMAKIQLALDRRSDAIKLLEKAHSHNIDSLVVGKLLVDLYLEDNQLHKALSVAQKVREANGLSAEALMNLARVHLASKEALKAQAVLKRAVQFAGFKAPLLEQIAQFQVRATDVDGAVYTLEKAKTADNSRAQTRVIITELAISREEPSLALAEIEWLRQNGYAGIAERLLGDLFSRQGDTLSALKQYLIALEHDPSRSNALRVFKAHMRNGSESDALIFVDRWLEANPEDQSFLEIQAQGYMRRGLLSQARRGFEALYHSGKRSPALLNNLALIYLANGDAEAVELAEEAFRLAPDNPEINDTLGWILVNYGQVSKGLKYLRNAHLRSSKDPEIRYHIAYALERLERYQEAFEEIREVLKYNDSDEVRALHDRLLSRLSK